MILICHSRSYRLHGRQSLARGDRSHSVTAKSTVRATNWSGHFLHTDRRGSSGRGTNGDHGIHYPLSSHFGDIVKSLMIGDRNDKAQLNVTILSSTSDVE